ncbi:FAD/NAD-P-binding domain-containing protein [Lactarius psammicola]|nr:FAD/NAD-P-binding domain-containing protein [Lactarius psammicola]
MLQPTGRLAQFKLDVIIVGGAIAGLSTCHWSCIVGHKVRVLEKSSKLGEPAGGIRLPPNVTKILMEWGLEEEIRKTASLVREGSISGITGKLIGYLEWAEPVIQDSGAKFYMMRYSDLHQILYDAATRAGAEVIFNADVRLASPPARGKSGGKPSVQLRDGTVLHADIIIGADGQHSTVRTSVQEKRVEPQVTDTIVFTGHIPMKRLLEDDVLNADKFAFSWVYWFGPRRACLGGEYAVHIYWDRKEPDAPEGWIPNMPTKSLKLSETALDGRLARFCWQKYLDWPNIENWSDESNRIVLVGESSRPLIPCSTQSSSLSVESAAVLSTLLSYVRGLDHIPLLVRAYETIRRDRSEFLHQVELMNVSQTMFPPGPERAARDEEMQKLLHAGQVKWDDDAYLGLWGQLCEIWAYNAFDAADDWWVQWGVLHERSLGVQDPNVETPLEVGIIARIDVIQEGLRS